MEATKATIIRLNINEELNNEGAYDISGPDHRITSLFAPSWNFGN